MVFRPPTAKNVNHEFEYKSKNKNRCQAIIAKTARFFIEDDYIRPTFKNSDLIIILLNLHINIITFITFIDMCLKSGGFVVIVIYAILTLLISPVLSFVVFFLGAYSGRSYLNIWAIFPLFKGIAATALIYNLQVICEVSSLAALFINLGYKTIYRVPWEKTNWDNSSCTINKKFNPNKVIDIPSFLFFRNEVLNHLKNHFPFIFLLWALLAIIGLFQYRRYRFCTQIILPLIAVTSLFVCFIYVIISFNEYPKKLVINAGFKNFGRAKVWLRVLSLTLCEIQSHSITLGCLCYTQKKIFGIFCFVYFIKLLAAMFYLIWLPFIGGAIQKIYGIKDASCISFTGLHVFMVMIPDTVTNIKNSHIRFLILMYYIGMLCWCISNIILNIDLTIFTVLEAWPKLQPLHNIMFMLITVFMVGGSIGFYGTSLPLVIHYFNYFTQYNIDCIIFFFIILSIFIYGINELSTDWFFVHGVPFPHITQLKILLLITFIFFWMYLSNLVMTLVVKKIHLNYVFYIVASITIFPIFLCIIIAIARRKKYGSGIVPSFNWGPVGKDDKFLRKLFYLENMFKYRLNTECDHNCLRDSRPQAKIRKPNKKVVMYLHEIFFTKLSTISLKKRMYFLKYYSY